MLFFFFFRLSTLVLPACALLVRAPRATPRAAPRMASAADVGPLKVSDSFAQTRRGDADGFSWTQTTRDLEFAVPLPAGARARDIACDVQRRRVEVRLRGRDAPLLAGAFWGDVLAAQAEWTVDDDARAGAPAGAKTLHLLVPKVKPFLAREEGRFRGAPVQVTQTDPMWPSIFEDGAGGETAVDEADLFRLRASFDPSDARYFDSDDPPTP